MKLKPIPDNTVVHTPTEAEAKELLSILHENGYLWSVMRKSLINNNHWRHNKENTTYLVDGKNKLVDLIKEGALMFEILTLAEFKERFLIEEEKPQPKFKVGDKVKVLENAVLINNIGRIATIVKEGECCKGHGWVLDISKSVFLESELAPHAEPETKTTEDMETKDEKSKIPINLCELLKEHEGETFYHLMYGEVEYKGVNKDGFIAFTDSKIPTIYDDGKYDQHANVVLYPSRTLYEQYPLDPYAAWMKWQEEQDKWKLRIGYSREDSIPTGEITDLFFRSTSDREKCIKEIKAIIEKYSKK